MDGIPRQLDVWFSLLTFFSLTVNWCKGVLASHYVSGLLSLVWRHHQLVSVSDVYNIHCFHYTYLLVYTCVCTKALVSLCRELGHDYDSLAEGYPLLTRLYDLSTKKVLTNYSWNSWVIPKNNRKGFRGHETQNGDNLFQDHLISQYQTDLLHDLF